MASFALPTEMPMEKAYPLFFEAWEKGAWVMNHSRVATEIDGEVYREEITPEILTSLREWKEASLPNHMFDSHCLHIAHEDEGVLMYLRMKFV
jgi:hypothetical protein